jgi:hypothetical protein
MPLKSQFKLPQKLRQRQGNEGLTAVAYSQAIFPKLDLSPS